MTTTDFVDRRPRRGAPGQPLDRIAGAPPAAKRGADGHERAALGLLAWMAAISATGVADASSSPARPAQHGGAGPLRRLAALWLSWRERRAERRYLQRLNDHLLGDIGLARRDLDRAGRSGRFGA